MKAETFNEEPKTRAAGAHKLAEEFSVAIFSAGAFHANGKMDMTTMDRNGRLILGKHTHGSIVEDIEAQAVPATLPNGRPTFEITIQTKDLSATYKGVLLLDAGGELAVGGCFKFDAARRPAALAEAEILQAQNEGVWVITKP
jgi:hypothetical protein